MEEQTNLYLVPTPIGNLEDITLRAIRILKEANIILAEDTRTSGKLLKHYEISTRMESYHKFNEHKAVDRLLQRMKAGEQFALISDAGTPAISDPGYLLSKAVLENGLKLEVLPGATAFVPAIIKSGFACDRFLYEGFLPHKKGRQTKMKQVAENPFTTVFYESPHRIVKALEQIVEFISPERKVSVSREISKMFEETITGTAEEVLENLKSREKVKGEIVLVISGKDEK
jgi:16S rRNA (cytidine1402-2'-O)-methyltransferase